MRRRSTDPTALALAGIVALAAALRFATISDQSFWYDESLTVVLVRAPFGARALGIDTDAEPPLYFALAWPWAKLFGTSEAGLRSLSALFGVATVPVAYSAARTLVSRRAGLVAAGLVALSPALVTYSQEARSYALFVLLSALSFMFFARLREEPTTRDHVGWAISSALALASHYFALFLVVPEALWLLARAPRRRATLLAVAAVGAAGLALLPIALRARSHGIDWIVNAPLSTRLGATGRYLAVGPGLANGLAAVVGLVLIGVVVLVWRRGDARTRRGTLTALAVTGAFTALPVLAAVAGTDYLQERHMLALFVPLAVVLAAGTVTSGAACRAGVAGGLLVAAIFAWQYVKVVRYDYLQRDDWRAVAHALGPERARRAVVVLPGWQARPLGLYHGLRLLLAPEPVRELDTVTYEGERPRPGPRHIGSPPAPFRQVGSVSVQRMTVTRYESDRAQIVRPTSFRRPQPWDGPVVFADLGG